ncbi:CobW family GTP-binding protein [Halomonas borealis]|uniref:CobW family GTP-binding protein n=1 Tax=Halomonas borealis TaxID=2508710 RepID=UPI0010A0AA12|nr:GTP-binding protein [Halomonas borealis]
MSSIREPIPVHVITGFLGSGKSSLIRRLLDDKPPGERWAVVINEFGRVGIDQALFESRDDVVVKGLPGGCLCCQLAFVLQASLVNLLHRHRPDRLLIEPSGLGHPAGLLDLLRDEGLGEALAVQDIVALLDPRRLDDARAREHETFRDQLAMADGVALTMTDLADETQRAAARDYLAALWPAKRWVVEAPHGSLPVERLLSGQGHREDVDSVSRSADHRVPSATEGLSAPTLELAGAPGREPSPGRPCREVGQSLGHRSLGWRWHAEEVFCLDALTAFLEALPRALRIKAVLHTDAGWRSYDRAQGRATLAPSAWRRDSRLELIADSAAMPEAEGLEAGLAACRR